MMTTKTRFSLLMPLVFLGILAYVRFRLIRLAEVPVDNGTEVLVEALVPAPPAGECPPTLPPVLALLRAESQLRVGPLACGGTVCADAKGDWCRRIQDAIAQLRE